MWKFRKRRRDQDNNRHRGARSRQRYVLGLEPLEERKLLDAGGQSPNSSLATGGNAAEVQNASKAYENPNLVNLYQAYQHDPSSVSGLAAKFPLLQIQGASVAVAVKGNGAVATLSSSLAKLGMQVTASSATYAEVDGYLPIAQLPAAVALPGAVSVSPIYKPISGPPLTPPSPVVPPVIVIFPGENPILTPTPPATPLPPSLPPLPTIPSAPTPTLPQLPPAPSPIPPPPAEPVRLPPMLSYLLAQSHSPPAIPPPALPPVAVPASAQRTRAAHVRISKHKDSTTSVAVSLNIALAPVAHRVSHVRVFHRSPRVEQSPRLQGRSYYYTARVKDASAF